MGLLNWFLGSSSGIKAALKQGAVVIDIRTVYEYDQGRMKGSINIPENRLASSIDRIKGFEKPVIICSDSYSRNAPAMRFLKKNGIRELYNGGPWEKVFMALSN